MKQAGLAYFRPYDLRHTCATLLIYEGRTLNEVARHLGHADPGFTARTYAHVYEDAEDRRQVTIEQAISRARVRVVFGEEPEPNPTTPRRTRKIPAVGYPLDAPEAMRVLYGFGGVSSVCESRRWKRRPMLLEDRRLKRNTNSSR